MTKTGARGCNECGAPARSFHADSCVYAEGASVEITEVAPEAVKVLRHRVEVGDKVFDVWGGTHTITKVRHFKFKSTFTRDDGPTFDVDGDSTITVIKGAGSES